MSANVCEECGQPEETDEGMLWGSECPCCGDWYCSDCLTEHEEECVAED